jgi:hypothetical protein
MVHQPSPTPSPKPSPAPSSARADLARFEALSHASFLEADAQLPRMLARLLGDRWAEHAPHFRRFSEVVAGPLDAAAAVNNRAENLPRLERWSPFGDRIEAIHNHPTYDDCGRHIYQDGEVIAAYGDDSPVKNVRALGLFLLSSHVGEAGHNCPVACTAGVVKSLRAKGSDALKAKWLPGLLMRDYPERLDGAQFMTEVQGGSDVGQNAVIAVPDGEDYGTTRWRIHGEKWFCSNAEADLILMTARVTDAGGAARAGTSGLGLFLVPRRLDDGSLNHYVLRRLKDKLGTRSMPSAEIDFEGAVAYAVGPAEEGFKTMMTQVIQTSRIYNTIAVAGNARRAFIVARAYARSRQAFGHPIADFPLVQGMLAELRGLYAGSVAGGLELAAMLDRAEAGRLSKDDQAFMRVAINLAKMRSSQHAHRAIVIAIETLGGNGAIESFSILPRLLRDNVVCENWEGTHNTLIAQTHRDFASVGLAPAFFAGMDALIARSAGDAAIAQAMAPARAAVAAARDATPAIAAVKDAGRAAFLLRPHAERLGDAFFAACWAADVMHEGDPAQRAGEVAALAHFVELHLARGGLAWDEATADRVALVAAMER